MAMPAQKPGRSEQAVGTPQKFLDAVKKRLGVVAFSVDLAASHDNFAAEMYFTEDVDALRPDLPWSDYCDGAWAWLNPPFGDISPWVEKAWLECRRGACIAVLVPAATDTKWWQEWVRGKGYVTFIQGRFAFTGHTQSYPKGLALVLYAPFLEGGDCSWKWAAK